MKEIDVKIETLEPMQVASARVVSESPEMDAWEKLKNWAKPRGYLNNLAEHPVFGFNNPSPEPGQEEYGYEFWIKVGAEIESARGIEAKAFTGGLYAVLTCEVKGEPWKTIPEAWQQLHEWVNASKYEYSPHQDLEKHLNPGAPLNEMVLELYYPIKESE